MWLWMYCYDWCVYIYSGKKILARSHNSLARNYCLANLEPNLHSSWRFMHLSEMIFSNVSKDRGFEYPGSEC